MRIKLEKIFAILTILFLLFSLLPQNPANAYSYTSTYNDIKLLSNDPLVEIKSAIIKPWNGHSNFITRAELIKMYNQETASLVEALSIRGNYETGNENLRFNIVVVIDYTKNGENYSYIHEMRLTPKQLFDLNSITIPNEENLQTLKIINNISADYELIIQNEKDVNSSEVLSKVINRDTPTSILYNSDTTYNFFVYDEVQENNQIKVHFQNLNLADDIANIEFGDLVKVENPNNYTIVYHNNVISKNSTKSELYLPKGKFSITYYEDYISYNYKDYVQEPLVIDGLGDWDVEAEIYYISNNSNNKLRVSMDYEFSKGDYILSWYPHYSLESQVVVNNQTISNKVGESELIFEMGSIKSGPATLLLTIIIDESTTIQKSIDFFFESNAHTLEGMVITAEDLDGNDLTSGEVILYQFSQDRNNARKIYTAKLNELNEYFIPSTYIISGHKYLVSVKDNSKNIYYDYEFIGNEINEIHFSKDTLEKLEIDVNDSTIDYAYVNIYEPTNRSYISNFQGLEWYISTKNSVVLDLIVYDEQQLYNIRNYKLNTLKFNIDEIPLQQYRFDNVKFYVNYSNELSTNQLKTNQNYAYVEYTDGDVKYSGEITLAKDGWYFTDYGSPYIYYDDYYKKLSVSNNLNTSGVEYEYKIEGPNLQEPIIKTTTSSSIEVELQEGDYKLTLLSVTPDANIISKFENVEFSVGGYSTDSLPERVFVDNETEFGSIIDGNIYLISDEHYLNWNYYNGAFSGYSLYYDKSINYLLYKVIKAESGDWIIDAEQVSGEDLESHMNQPLTIQSNFSEIGIKESASNNINLSLTTSAGHRFQIYFNQGEKIYTNENLAKIEYALYDSQGVSNFYSYKNIEPNTVLQGDLFNFDIHSNGESILQGISIDNYYVEGNKFNVMQNQYDEIIAYLVPVPKPNHTKWMYEVSLENYDVNQDVLETFILDVQGQINDIEILQEEEWWGEINHILAVDYTLNAGKFNVNSISRFEEYSYDYYSKLSDVPIKEHIGNFSNVKEVPIEYHLYDQNGKLLQMGILEGSNDDKYDKASMPNYEEFKKIYLNEALVDGQYKLKLLVGIEPGETLTIEKEFRVGNYIPPVIPPINNGGIPSQPAPTPTPEPGITIITPEDLENQINSNVEEIVITIQPPSEEVPTATLQLPQNVLEGIVNSNIPVVVNVGGVEITLPTSSLENIHQQGLDVVSLVISSQPSENDRALSNRFSFTWNGLIGEETKNLTNVKFKVSIPVDEDKVVKEDNVAVYRVDPITGELQYVISHYNNGELTFNAIQNEQYIVVENSKTFGDISSSWAKEMIESLAAKGIIKGKSENEFDPKSTITRAEFTLLIARLFNLKTDSITGTFSDVNEKNSYAAGAIEAAARVGLITGSNGEFRPNDAITREQLVTIIMRALNNSGVETGPTPESPFADVAKFSPYANDYINGAANLGIINGIYQNGVLNFAPKSNATREEASKIIYLLNRNLK